MGLTAPPRMEFPLLESVKLRFFFRFASPLDSTAEILALTDGGFGFGGLGDFGERNPMRGDTHKLTI